MNCFRWVFLWVVCYCGSLTNTRAGESGFPGPVSSGALVGGRREVRPGVRVRAKDVAALPPVLNPGATGVSVGCWVWCEVNDPDFIVYGDGFVGPWINDGQVVSAGWHLIPNGVWNFYEGINGSSATLDLTHAQYAYVFCGAEGDMLVASDITSSVVGVGGDETKWFWTGFTMAFGFGMVGLGTKWSGRIMGGGGSLNE